MLLLVHSGSRASKYPWPWQLQHLGGRLRPMPMAVASLQHLGGRRRRGLGPAMQRPPARWRRTEGPAEGPPHGVGVTCKMIWRKLHMLRLCVQIVGCLMHELLYLTLFMLTRFRFKLFQTYVSQHIIPLIPIPAICLANLVTGDRLK